MWSKVEWISMVKKLILIVNQFTNIYLHIYKKNPKSTIFEVQWKLHYIMLTLLYYNLFYNKSEMNYVTQYKLGISVILLIFTI